MGLIGDRLVVDLVCLGTRLIENANFGFVVCLKLFLFSFHIPGHVLMR